MSKQYPYIRMLGRLDPISISHRSLIQQCCPSHCPQNDHNGQKSLKLWINMITKWFLGQISWVTFPTKSKRTAIRIEWTFSESLNCEYSPLPWFYLNEAIISDISRTLFFVVLYQLFEFQQNRSSDFLVSRIFEMLRTSAHLSFSANAWGISLA